MKLLTLGSFKVSGAATEIRYLLHLDTRPNELQVLEDIDLKQAAVKIGAIVCDIHGAPLDLNRHDSTFMNHRGIIYSSDQTIADRIIY
ncbi:MAG: hypothetical protein QNL62_13820 [Gammaproteobacteria bacterium]|nr:hypothetical protein [Gammaproteobacteria bacterium]